MHILTEWEGQLLLHNYGDATLLCHPSTVGTDIATLTALEAMVSPQPHSDRDNAAHEPAQPRRARAVGRSLPFLATLWFGLLAGWLELAVVTAQAAVKPHVSVETLRTNRHLVWMVLVSDVLIFSAVGLAIALLATLRPRAAYWVALRVPLAMVLSAPLLNIIGLHPMGAVVLAFGAASVLGRWLERRGEGFGRLVRVSFPALAVGTAVLTGLAYERVRSAEQRALTRCPGAQPGAPNVLLIVLDTVRAASLSLHGHYRPTTPNLERLARKGIVFTEARATSPWTAPTHASLLTGRWPHELSVAPGVPLDGTFPTLAEVLGREGYATAGFVGNIYYCNALYGMNRGFAQYEDAYENQTVSLFETVWSSGLGKRVIQALGYSTRLDDGVTLLRKTAAMLNRDVLGWLDRRPAGRPFFVFVNYYDAHRPYVFRDDPGQRFGKAALPEAEQSEIDKRFLEMAAGKPAPADVSAEQVHRDAMDLYHDSYDSCIAYLDRQVGLLLDEMERRGLLDNTLVIVTSDHGEQLGEHGLISHGASVYRPEVHVPLVVIPPSRPANAEVVTAPVSLRDVPATVAEWADLGVRSPFPGHSLTRFLEDGKEPARQTSPVLTELQHNIAFPDESQIPLPFGPARSLVSRDRVYIRRDDGHEELYDLLNDPHETFDLAKDPRSGPVIARFRQELNQFRRDASTQGH